MNNRINNRSVLMIILMSLFITNIIVGQVALETKMKPVNDSLSLKNIIERVITSHPSVKAAEEAINNANARIGLAKTGYYPEVDVTANYSNLSPVTKITIPSMGGTFQLYPENNYSASINYRQLIYDFGRTRQNIELENGNKALSEQTLEHVKQKLSLLSVNNFYTLVFLQAAIKIKEEQLAALNQHLQYVEKMMATGSATEYQVLTTKVKISTVQSQLVDLVAALTAQQASLNSLIGNDQTAHPVVKTELSAEFKYLGKESSRERAPNPETCPLILHIGYISRPRNRS